MLPTDRWAPVGAGLGEGGVPCWEMGQRRHGARTASEDRDTGPAELRLRTDPLPVGGGAQTHLPCGVGAGVSWISG